TRRAAARRARPRRTRGSRGCARSRSRSARACPSGAPPRTGGWSVAPSRPPHLAVDLVLADHDRLEARGDAEEVARGLAVARRVGGVRELRGADAGVL